MSLENEDGRSLDKGSEKTHVVSKKPAISYSRDFLLSLSTLDICKKLPSGLGESLISEFEDALLSLPDRPRIHGSSSLQGFRRNDYSSSPPTRGDSGNYSRYGKWESRSSARSDRDSDSQSDKDSDSGRRYGHQPRRPWQTPEHDGLLGSGSFPRPSGYTSGIPAPKVRTSEQNQLSKSNEPYHPPRPYKAVPHTRRDTDAFNDETFGSMECTNEDRAEEERKRRASFEMMRKEQHKALQEKQQLNLDKLKGGSLSVFGEVLEDGKEEKGHFIRSNELEVSAAIPILSNSLEKSSFMSHSPASRPIVPPGFKTNILEKSSGLKSQIQPPLSEAGKPVIGESLVDSEANFVQNGGKDVLETKLSQDISLVDGLSAGKTQQTRLLNKGENVNLHVPIKKFTMEGQVLRVAGFNSRGTLDNLETAEVSEEKFVGDSKSSSTSILETIFGSTLSMNDGGSSSAELHDSKPDDTWSASSAQSSKFAQWFFEEETKAADDISSARPNDLLSLIVSGDKANGVSDQEPVTNKVEATPTPSILTCEDLEQSILSQFSEKPTKMQPPSHNWVTTGANDQPTAHVDNHASLNLLSMLQKGTDQSNAASNPGIGMNLSDKPLVSRENDMSKIVKEPKGEEKINSLPNLGNSLTLEALFGSSFMKELQSVEAPVSVQRNEPHHGLPFPAADIEVSSNHKHHQFQLPEEDTLISVGDTRNNNRAFMPSRNSVNDMTFSQSPPIDIMEKLTGGGSYEQMDPEIPYRNLQVHQSPQMRPFHHHHLGSHPAHVGPGMKFAGPEAIFNRDSPPTHQFSSSSMIRPPFNNPNVRVSGFEAPSHHSMMHQMQMSGNHHPHMLPDFPRGGPVSHHGNQATGLIPEMNQMHGFPLGPRQPNIVRGGVQMPAGLNINSGGNPPEAFQRLMEMELRANSKQIHPMAPGGGGGGHSQGMYGHEVDMGFRYR